MELLVKNKLGSISGGSKVLNEKDEQVYLVKGNVASNMFSKKHRKKIMTMDKKLLYSVCDKRIHGPISRACIIYDANEKEIARVKQNSMFKCGYEIEGVEKKMEIVGHFLDSHGADIMYGGEKIGNIISGNIKKVSEKGAMLSVGITDKYKLNFKDEEDGPLLVAVVIAIDNMRDADKRRAANNRHVVNIGG